MRFSWSCCCWISANDALDDMVQCWNMWNTVGGMGGIEIAWIEKVFTVTVSSSVGPKQRLLCHQMTEQKHDRRRKRRGDDDCCSSSSHICNGEYMAKTMRARQVPLFLYTALGFAHFVLVSPNTYERTRTLTLFSSCSGRPVTYYLSTTTRIPRHRERFLDCPRSS
jgi:hypothetical protein